MQWTPDMIWFDNARVLGLGELRGAEAVHEQRRRPGGAEHRHRHPVAAAPPITGAVGLSTWATAAAYDDVRVTGRRRGHAVQRRLLRRRLEVDATDRDAAAGRSQDGAVRPVRHHRRRTPWCRAGRHEPGATTRCSSKATQDSRHGGLPRRLRRQGHRQLLLVEPRRLEQHPVRRGEGRGRRQVRR